MENIYSGHAFLTIYAFNGIFNLFTIHAITDEEELIYILHSVFVFDMS